MATAKRSVYSYFYFVAAVLLLAYIAMTISSLHQFSGWLLMLFFVSLAIAFRGNNVSEVCLIRLLLWVL